MAIKLPLTPKDGIPLLPLSPPSPPRILRRRPTRRVFLFYAAAALMALSMGSLLISLGRRCNEGGNCYHGYYSSFSFDAADAPADNAAWMAGLPDDAPLSSLSIPGTHDTMTYAMVDNEHLQCQNWNLSSQLAAGVRYLDIRARLRDDRLHIYHGSGYTGFSYEHVLLQLFAFLEAHPSETVVVRLKQEASPLGTNIGTFEDAFNYQRFISPATSAGAAKHITLYDRTAPLPTLGSLRSKAILLQEFPTANDTAYGVKWDGPQMQLEDYWIIPGVYYLADKWRAIRTAFESATTAPLDNSKLFVAHISASVGVLPIEAAAGPLNRTISGMNDMTGQWLADFEDSDEATRVGIVIFDFPGKDAIRNVLRWNKHVRKRVTS